MEQKRRSRYSSYSARSRTPQQASSGRMTALEKCANRAVRRMGRAEYKTGSTSCDTRLCCEELQGERVDSVSHDMTKEKSVYHNVNSNVEGRSSDSVYESAQACECDIPGVYPPGRPTSSSSPEPAETSTAVVALSMGETDSDVGKFSRVGVSCLEDCCDSDSSYGELEKRSVGSTSTSSHSAFGDIAIAACCDEGLKEECSKGEESDVTDTITLSSVAEKLKNFQERCRRRRLRTKPCEQSVSKTVRQANRCMARRLRGKNTKFFCLW